MEASRFIAWTRFASLYSPVMRIHFVISILTLVSSVLGLHEGLERDVGTLFNGMEGRHTNNWAVLVDTSRYWFNYRVRRDSLAPALPGNLALENQKECTVSHCV